MRLTGMDKRGEGYELIMNMDRQLIYDFLEKASAFRAKGDDLYETAYFEAAADLLPLIAI